jgi:hypothetical protein
VQKRPENAKMLLLSSNLDDRPILMKSSVFNFESHPLSKHQRLELISRLHGTQLAKQYTSGVSHVKFESMNGFL